MSTQVETQSFNPGIEYYPPTLLAKHGIQLSDNAATADVYPPTADIGWVPDLAKFQERTLERMKTVPQGTQVPKGWPKAVRHPLAWTGSDLKPEDYVLVLSTVDIAEIMAALSNFKSNLLTAGLTWHWFHAKANLIHLKGRGLELREVRKATFPLPLLGPRLESASRNVHDGRGFCVVRGLNPASFSREDNAILYLGVSSYFGEQRGRQYQDGSMMSE